MSLVEFTRSYKDYSYIPGDTPHLVVAPTNAYTHINASSVTGGVMVTSVTVTPVLEPLIPGTKIPVYRIAALLSGGMTVEEVFQDFPSLSHDKIRFAKSYAADHPNYWRIYPSTSFKRRLREVGFYDAMK